MGDRKDSMAKKNQEVKVQTTETEPIVRQVSGANELAPLTTQPLNPIESYLVWKAFTKLNDNDETKSMIPAQKMEGIIEKTLRVRFGFTSLGKAFSIHSYTHTGFRLCAVLFSRNTLETLCGSGVVPGDPLVPTSSSSCCPRNQ